MRSRTHEVWMNQATGMYVRVAGSKRSFDCCEMLWLWKLLEQKQFHVSVESYVV
jgi:hypothetical protein